MKKSFILLITLLVTGIVGILSCDKKPLSSSPLSATSSIGKPPVAVAGPDIVINDSTCGSLSRVLLDGSGSYDPDDRISFYLWRNISGPTQILIRNQEKSNAFANNLRTGLYAFELLVIDLKGNTSRDTMFVDAGNWELKEYDLDITIKGAYIFNNNWENCYDGTCDYIDITTINGSSNFSPIGLFGFSINEYSDSSDLSDSYERNFLLESASTLYYTVFARGNCSISFKSLIRNGGGAFNGNLIASSGSASRCGIYYNNFSSLIVNGNIDTTTHAISLRIQGRIYF